jgi:hypothetical protein
VKHSFDVSCKGCNGNYVARPSSVPNLHWFFQNQHVGETRALPRGCVASDDASLGLGLGIRSSLTLSLEARNTP